jgi:hypothetical protein
MLIQKRIKTAKYTKAKEVKCVGEKFAGNESSVRSSGRVAIYL